MSEYLYYIDDSKSESMKHHITVSYNNSKLGNIINVSLMNGNGTLTLKTGQKLNNIIGYCPMSCKFCNSNKCYATKTVKRFHPDMVPYLSYNTLIYKYEPERFFSELKNKIQDSLIPVVRFNVYNEVPECTYLYMVFELAESMPDRKFYLYSSRHDFIKTVYDKIPENVYIMFSGSENVKNDELLAKYPKCNIFCTVDKNRFDELKNSDVELCKNSVDRTKCEKCKKCFTLRGKIIYEQIK